MHMTIPLKELQAALKAPAVVVPKPPVIATPLQDRTRMAWTEQPELFGEGVA